MRARITITGADLAEFPGKITPPDYPIEFEGEIGHVSIHDLAQTEGKARWQDMHGEMPSQVYFQTSFPKEEGA